MSNKETEGLEEMTTSPKIPEIPGKGESGVGCGQESLRSKDGRKKIHRDTCDAELDRGFL